ncbi:LuxR C-terminal-related transcriptional regulator [Rhizobium pusense]|uniref:helix-turn-helix transcriptional regulator n=1 Tax=Agrobacterium pusense TaxID=648995 RepID=UPI00142E92D8|nr:LuxR C-terminal-related transcriptional regulator [Agrobacterium pusense]MDH0116123.1 LuxR C-terminal-related transcriptional regulator [Agrobacterium pusense]
MMLLPRPHLCNRIASETAGVVFLRAPAGAGKSVLLETLAKELGAQICRTHQPQSDDAVNGNLLWDIPVFARAVRMPAPILESVRFVVIACRPDQRISGMARHILHHGSLTIGPEELALRPDEVDDLPPGQRRLALEDYAGWPAFLSLARLPDDTLCADYLRENYLPHLTPAQTVELSFWLENPSAAPDADWAMLLPPFLTGKPDNHHTLIRLLTVAARERLATLQAGSAVVEVASAFEKAGHSLAAMAMLLDRGYETHAAQILERAHGRELIYRSSVDRFREIIMRFSQDMITSNETVLFAVTRALLKQGELQRVRHLLGKSLGSDYLDPLKVLARGSRFSFAARTFRLNLMIAEDLTPNDAVITRLGEFMADYPMDDHGKWAAYYNALLEFEIRRRNFREAEAAAARALIYLRKMGGQPLLEFFIHLHQIVLRLMSGDVLLARRAAQEARARLEQVPHDAMQEFRMLRLAEACLAYEAGKPRDLLHFVEHDFDHFAAAEIWPSLMQFALHYASQVLIDHFPMTVRPGFLDGLWIHLSEGLQFHAMMEIRTAIAYQNANRWADAAATLSAVRMPMGRNWVESAHEDLSRLTRRDEIAYVMAWLRDAVHLFTPRAYLSRQIDAMIANPKVTNREKVALRIWQSYAAHQRRDNAAARAHILTALESATRLGCNGVLSEERVFLSPLLNNRRIRSFIETSSDVRTALSIFAASVNSPQARALHGGLSQREAQMLQLLASGMSNKKIAQTLNISEVTVKFHLGNLFRKLDCKRRAEAIRAAKALGWL